MKCPACKAEIGFVESLTVMNPLSFKCQKCRSYLSLTGSSIKEYIVLLCIIAVLSFSGFYILADKNLLTRSLLTVLVPIILLVVLLIHFFFWSRAEARVKDDKMSDITNLGC